MMKAEELGKEIMGYYAVLGEPIAKGVPDELVEDLDRRCQILARSSVLLAEAQLIHDRKRGEVASHAVELSATALREFLTGACADEMRLLKLADRLNNTCVRQIDAIRSVLSYEKEKARL
jgi:hypothetical protein